MAGGYIVFSSRFPHKKFLRSTMVSVTESCASTYESPWVGLYRTPFKGKLDTGNNTNAVNKGHFCLYGSVCDYLNIPTVHRK
ncbi:hypothetical protein H8356DRAFT_1419843 [Neocallimastix lanati (nom. inval.)]|nr:hypothetical protein H8356DRAFT_1419843 [Neocallimastix sp. JGI-2020a]